MGTPTIVVFNGLTVAGDASSPYNLQSLTGWRGDLPPAVFDDEQRPNAHGVFGSPVWAAARTVSLVGECRTNQQRDALLAAFSAATVFSGSATPPTLAINQAGLTLNTSAQVIRSGAIKNPGEWGLGRFGFQVDWRCTDPILYGTLVTVGPLVLAAATGGAVFPAFPSGVFAWGTLPTPQTATLTNSGSADAPVVLTVSANGAAFTGGFQIIETSTGRILRYVDDLAAGDVVVFDSSTGSVTINASADRRNSVSVGQWTPVPAASSRTFYLAPLGANSTASLTAAMRPAYW